MSKTMNNNLKCKIYLFHSIVWMSWMQIAVGQHLADHSERILSRQRRYLIFPGGSSIQFVWDIDMYVAGWDPSNAITSYSVGLAWGLPEKPTYPEEHLMHLYAEGDLPLIQNRKDENATNMNALNESNVVTTTTKTASRIDNQTLLTLIRLFLSNGNKSIATLDSPMELDANYVKNILDYFNDQIDYNNRRHGSATTINYEDRFYSNDYYPFGRYNSTFANITRHPDVVNNYINRNAFQKYLVETYFMPWIESAKISTQATSKQPKKPTTKRPPFKPKINKSHIIYPALGKRSVRSASMTWEEKFFMDHHRNTRHKFYGIIEKYLFAKGQNGTACVLKTLCEVGKKRSDNEPGTFLAEIARAIFSLPEAVTNRVIDKRHVYYDEAHRTDDDCKEIFDKCPCSIWEVDFMIEYYD